MYIYFILFIYFFLFSVFYFSKLNTNMDLLSAKWLYLFLERPPAVSLLFLLLWP
jgi:hypothetical protein